MQRFELEADARATSEARLADAIQHTATAAAAVELNRKPRETGPRSASTGRSQPVVAAETAPAAADAALDGSVVRRDDHMASLARLEAASQETRHALALETAACKTAQRQVDRIANDLQQARNEIATLWWERRVTSNSTVWRLTEPLRALGRRLPRGLRARLRAAVTGGGPAEPGFQTPGAQISADPALASAPAPSLMAQIATHSTGAGTPAHRLHLGRAAHSRPYLSRAADHGCRCRVGRRGPLAERRTMWCRVAMRSPRPPSW